MPKKVKFIEISFVEKERFRLKLPKFKKGKYFYLNVLSLLTLIAIPVLYYVQNLVVSNYQKKLNDLDKQIRIKVLTIKRLNKKLDAKQRMFETLYISDIKEKYFISRLYKYFNKAIYEDFNEFYAMFKGNLYYAFIVFPNPVKLDNHLLLPEYQRKGLFLEDINPFLSNLNIATSVAIYVENLENKPRIKELKFIKDKELKASLAFQIYLLNHRNVDLVIPITLIYPVSYFYKNMKEKEKIVKNLKEYCNYFIKNDQLEYNRVFGSFQVKGYIQGFCIRNIWYKVRDKVW